MGILHSVASKVAVADIWMVLKVMSRISDICSCPLWFIGIVLGGRRDIVVGTRSRRRKRSFLSIGLWWGRCFVLGAGRLG